MCRVKRKRWKEEGEEREKERKRKRAKEKDGLFHLPFSHSSQVLFVFAGQTMTDHTRTFCQRRRTHTYKFKRRNSLTEREREPSNRTSVTSESSAKAQQILYTSEKARERENVFGPRVNFYIGPTQDISGLETVTRAMNTSIKRIASIKVCIGMRVRVCLCVSWTLLTSGAREKERETTSL